jgi:hypothetical protein
MVYINKQFKDHIIKTISDPISAKNDVPFKYYYIFDLSNMPFKDLIGYKYYPHLCIWDGEELNTTNIDIRSAIGKIE